MKIQRLLARTVLVLFIGLFSVFSLPLSASAYSPTQATLCNGFTRLGRNGCYGYFTNTNFYGTYGIQGENVLDCVLSSCTNGESVDNEIVDSVDTAPTFEGLITGDLGSGTAYTYNKAGAAFIVDAMLGKAGSSFGTLNAGITYAQANIATWESRVNYYSQQGWITWNEAVTLPENTINTMHTCVTSQSDCELTNIASNDGKDFAFFNTYESEASHLIVFHNPDGNTFEIRRECGNLVGNLDPLTAVPSITATCGSVSINPSRPDPDTAYKITAAVDYANSADATTAAGSGDDMFIDVSGPSVSYSNSNVTPVTQSGAILNGTASLSASHNTGTYTITYGMSGAVGPVSCTSSLVIADQPTTTITGDSEAGEGMGGTTCATPADNLAGIVSWNQEAAGGYAGAGTAYAALVLNHLQDFATGQGSSLAPSGLSFANTSDGDVNPSSGLFGGLFGAESCTPDYFANATNVQTGNITIGATTVANGTHTSIYVKGNVYITGDIKYSGSYGSVNDIPSYSIIVEGGNIYVAPGVDQLDGLYVAEPTVSGGVSTNGIIYTCASGPFAAAALNSALYATCDLSPLTVNGSFVARQVWLLRTTGTVSGTDAEAFDYDPEIWLTTPPASSTSSSTLGDGYDAITSLPPVL